MILIVAEGKACPKLQQELRHILDQRLLNVALHHIRFERDDVKDMRVFHGLCRKLALRGWQSIFKVGYLLRQHLLLIQATFDLMD